MADIPTTEPSIVNAGDTVRWTKTLADHPATDGWVLAYTFINAAGKFTLTASASGVDHAVNAAPATTNAWPAGDYDWRAQVSKAGDVFTVAEGRITVRASFGASTLDARSTARKALEAVEAYLANSNNISAAEYQIAGRQLRRFNLPELWAHRDRLRQEVAREDAAASAAAGLPDKRRVYVRFGR